MATTDILPFGTGGSANVVTQAAYAADSTTSNGFSSGVAPSNKLNKVWRQSSFIAAGLANWMVGQNVSVPDDGNLSSLVTKITTALTTFISSIANGFSTGDVKLTLKTTPDTGWIMCNDGTIGNASSGASNRANADTAALYALIWGNVSNTYAPVSGGRGGSAAADYAANKTITITAMLGRAIAIAGSGSALTARALGQTLGEEAHTLTSGESAALTFTSTVTDPGHSHLAGYNVGAPSGANTGVVTPYAGTGSATSTATTGITVSTTSNAGGGAHNNMQPSAYLNAMIKL